MAIQIGGTTVIDNSRNVIAGLGASMTVGSGAFVTGSSIGLGYTDTTGRDAGIGTAVGTLIYNEDELRVQVYDGTNWIDGLASPFSATGGTEDTTSRSGYKIHTFTSPGTFTVTEGTRNVEYLIVSGGGGGNFNTHTGGGGGAGGVESGTTVVSTGSYPVTRGAGGTASPSNQFGARGGNGTASSVFGTSAGVQSDSPGATNGQTSGNNYVGGTSPAGNGAPGGGGAGGDGLDAPGATGGAGGPGVSNSITGTSVTYGGGGGGGSENTTTAPGGSGGGGNGARTDINATAGSTNTGGGGGGGRSGYFSGSYRAAGGGGSGIVIIAYPTA